MGIERLGVQKVRKLPVVVEACQWVPENRPMLAAWMSTGISAKRCPDASFGPPHDILLIQTNEGEMKAEEGDWIIKGVHGEFYPCKPDIFAETYEFVDGGVPAAPILVFSASNWEQFRTTLETVADVLTDEGYNCTADRIQSAISKLLGEE